MSERRNWTREELIVAFNLYLKLPFGKLHSGNKDIIDLATKINRTPSSVAMRLNNFAAVDPFHQQRGIGGLKGGKKQVEPIFKEFVNNRDELLFESERILAKLEHTSIEEKFKDEFVGLVDLKGEERIREVKTRVNQHVFRQMVLSNYNSTCAISGIDLADLLIASHIIPWNANAVERLNPENGICLSSMYDRAFDKGLITFGMDFKVILSPKLKLEVHKSYFDRFFGRFEGAELIRPKKYLPRESFLKYHYEEIFIK